MPGVPPACLPQMRAACGRAPFLCLYYPQIRAACPWLPACLQIIEGAKGIDRKVYGPYLLLLEPEQLAVLTMHRSVRRQRRWRVLAVVAAAPGRVWSRRHNETGSPGLQGLPFCRPHAPAPGAYALGAKTGGQHLPPVRPTWHRLPPSLCRSVINAIVAAEDAGGGAFSSPGQARVTRLSLTIGKVRLAVKQSRASSCLGAEQHGQSANCGGLPARLVCPVSRCMHGHSWGRAIGRPAAAAPCN